MELEIELSQDQQQALNMFETFLADEEAFDMYITGQAGTGKSTMLYQVLKYAYHNKIPTVVCAYTHKAKGVLEKILPDYVDVRTLHSFLKKRPNINEDAKNINRIQVSRQFGKPEPVKLLIVDEYSMVGESDAMSIGELQDPDYEGLPQMKVVYIGDERQIPPVKAQFTLQAEGSNYHANLTTIHRQGKGPLLDTICELVDMIDGKAPIHKLEPNKQFMRDTNIVKEFLYTSYPDKIMLAYTNRRVQELNQQVVDKSYPTEDRWCPTLKEELEIEEFQTADPATRIWTHSGWLELSSKYRTLEHLISMQKEYPQIVFADYEFKSLKETKTLAYVFGHGDYNDLHKELQLAAANANNAIDHPSPKNYCMKNPHCKECRQRAKAWRNYLTFTECVMCIDYPYAQTVHKSQGSTYDAVFIDNDNLKLSKDMYLKLLYVAISRAKYRVYTNS